MDDVYACCVHFQGAVGLELWSMSDDIVFDNFIITDSKSVADVWAADTWEVKRLQEVSGGSSAVSSSTIGEPRFP